MTTKFDLWLTREPEVEMPEDLRDPTTPEEEQEVAEFNEWVKKQVAALPRPKWLDEPFVAAPRRYVDADEADLVR